MARYFLSAGSWSKCLRDLTSIGIRSDEIIRDHDVERVFPLPPIQLIGEFFGLRLDRFDVMALEQEVKINPRSNGDSQSAG